MIDNKKIIESVKKLIDILSGEGFTSGKLEVDYDIQMNRIKTQVHQFENIGNEKIIRTTISVK